MTMISFFYYDCLFFWIESLCAVSSVMTERLTLVLLELNLPNTLFLSFANCRSITSSFWKNSIFAVLVLFCFFCRIWSAIYTSITRLTAFVKSHCDHYLNYIQSSSDHMTMCQLHNKHKKFQGEKFHNHHPIILQSQNPRSKDFPAHLPHSYPQRLCPL